MIICPTRSDNPASPNRKYRGVSKYDLKLPITHPYDFFLPIVRIWSITRWNRINSIKKKRNKYHSIVFKKGFKFNITSIGGHTKTRTVNSLRLCDFFFGSIFAHCRRLTYNRICPPILICPFVLKNAMNG